MTTLRTERPGDADAIRSLTRRAFEPKAFSDGTEPAVIDRLRASGELVLSLVAERADAIVGHVAFSAAAIGDSGESGWYALGPISVEPALQRTGIGTALIEAGASRLHEDGARGLVLVGDPAYYARLGFVSDGRLAHGDLPGRLVQHRAFGRPPPRGELRFADAFEP